MKIIRYFAKNISLLNVLLAGVIVVTLVYALFPLFSVRVGYEPAPGKEGQDVTLEKAQPGQVPSPSDYTVVAENNLFHPDRMVPPQKTEEKQLPKPELVLYGTVIAGDQSFAYVDDAKAPYSTPGRGKRPRVLKKGDAISGFVVKEIQTNRIILVRKEEVITVSLDTVKVRADEGGRAQPAASAAQRAAVPSPGMPQVPAQRRTVSAAEMPTATMPTATMPAPPVGVAPSLPQRQIRAPARQ